MLSVGEGVEERREGFEVFVFECDGFESHGDPYNGRFIGRNDTCLSFIALEKSIETADEFPG